ncbi:hypothetical protein Bca4012_097125 [Brassica carinata]
MPKRRITRTPTKKMGTMALRDTDLLLQCSISLHPPPLETLAFLQLMTFSLRWIHKVLCKYLQISGPPEFLNNRTEADEEATARDAEHAKRMTQMKGSPFDDVNCVSTKENPAASAILILMFRLLHTYGFGSFIGVVMEAKPQLVGIHERVRNDIDAQPS